MIKTEKCTQNNTTTNLPGAVTEKIPIESAENRENKNKNKNKNKNNNKNKNSVLSKFHIAENSHDCMKILFRKGSPHTHSISNISKDGLKIKIHKKLP